MRTTFNYKHLYYFWVVAKEGGITRAADKLDMAVQTVSAQVRELERSLGYALLKPAGRGLVLTDAGLAAMQQADQIFQLGENLPALVRDAVSSPTVRLAAGISDGLPKLVVRRIMQPVMSEPHLRLLCHEGEFDELLGDLALHRLDVVLSDRPAPSNANIKPILCKFHADIGNSEDAPNPTKLTTHLIVEFNRLVFFHCFYFCTHFYSPSSYVSTSIVTSSAHPFKVTKYPMRLTR